MTRCLVLLIALSFAATVAQGDEWDDAMAVPGTVAAVPEHLWFPYVSTYYVKPIVTTAETLRVGYYVTDWNQSEVRADDRTRRFDLTLEVWRDDEIVRTLAATNAPAGDGAFAVSPLDEGEYVLRLWAKDRTNGLESHRVLQEFRVSNRPPAGERETYRMTAADAAGLGTNVLEGLQRLWDEKAAGGVRRFVMWPGVYRVDAGDHLRMPDDFTLDLNGATIRQNGFAGCHGLVLAFESARDAHLVNGTVMGDLLEHDFAHSDHDSEWVLGIGISGACRDCTVSNVVVRDVTGYGGSNGQGTDRRGKPQAFTQKFKGAWTNAAVDVASGGLVPDAARWTSDWQDFRKAAGEARQLQISRCGGYQGMALDSWWMTVGWYDGERRFLGAETAFQYRRMLVPRKARFLRVSVQAASEAALRTSRLKLHASRAPVNCAVIGCRFENCRCVGYAASAMRNMLFKDNVFTRCGDTLAMSAFDAEDGWDEMQDVTFAGNVFHDNSVNDGLFFCAGHNFVVERNRGDLWILNRTYSPCVRSNEVGVALYENGGRMRAGYGRFEGNGYSTGVSYASDGPDGWTHLPDRKSRCIPWGWAFRTLKGRIRNGRLK
mgnify:CR=1 FL=1